MEPVLCFPDPVPDELAATLEAAGYAYEAVSGLEALVAAELSPKGAAWAGVVVFGVEEPAAALRFCRQVRRREAPLSPLLLVVAPRDLEELAVAEDLFDDFVVEPPAPGELAARLAHLLWRAGRGQEEVIEHGPLVVNLETYQAAVDGRVLDLTYMEYELLRFLASHPGKVFTREMLLSRVWGYEYYGGARTVDVHVRRLRAKLGEEHAALIQTVRSVGYRFGQAPWSPAPGT